ncbi:hypothetical protein [Haloferula sp. BvORR071]|uniref:hypothetical protein n=1 Tax=Haloferula sp. BvORR071 TaxID=1396141 RepID=UPI0005500E9A|nr:hypothetical protein [Haloferula sp. BvORR071]
MSDFRKQVRDHYDAQSLPAEKLEAILARGREAAVEGEKTVEFPATKKRSWARYAAAIAAAIVLALGGTWWMKRDVGEVSLAALPPRVIEFFAKAPNLHEAIQDKTELRNWLISQGAPADIKIPTSLQTLQSAACSVVDVQGRKAYLSCYVREKNSAGGVELIHLLVARSEDFYDQPRGREVVVKEEDGWSFASWTEGDTIYTLATAAPKEKLEPFRPQAGLPVEKQRHLSGLEAAVSGMAALAR